MSINIPFHQISASGRWFEFPLAYQLGNIGGEIQRYINAKNRNDEDSAVLAFYRAIELIDLTKNDPKHRTSGRLKEICRLKLCLCDAVLNNPTEYNSDINELNNYCNNAALAHRYHLRK